MKLEIFTGRIAQLISVGLLSFILSHPALAQQDSLKNLVEKFDHYRDQNFQEKIFIHTDQIFYLTGETIWFNVFLVDAFFHQPSQLSKVVYLEVIGKDNISVIKTKIAVTEGHGHGSLFLPSSIASGKYRILGYTRWMQNFSPEFYFQQSITIVNPFVNLDPPPASEGPAYDIQFFPEGGNIIAGLPNTVAFRVVGKNGKGIGFKGAILNQKNDTVVRFHPLKFGLGRFHFNPEKGEHYSSVIIDSLHQKYFVPLPAILDEGFTMHLTDSIGFINVAVRSRFLESAEESQKVHLFVQSHQIHLAGLTNPLTHGTALFRIDKKIFREGLNHITLFDHSLRPVGERMYFVTPKHNLKISAAVDRENYSTREKINLNLTTLTAEGHPANPRMSVSVYRQDSLQQDEPVNISDYLWLTSELKGTVESPGFYLKEANAEAADNLMLTHGWSRFTWKEILSHQENHAPYAPEYGGHLLRGVVLDQEGNPSPGINTFLSVVGKKAELRVARSDAKGNVMYEVHDFFGKQKVVAQTNANVDSTFKVELKDELTKLPENTLPEFSLSVGLRHQLVQRNLAMQLQHAFDRQDQNVPPGTDSLPFYGKALERYRLDDFTRFPTMEEVMREYIRNVMVRKKNGKFKFIIFDPATRTFLDDNPLVMLDGVPVFNLDHIIAYDPLKVQKIDVIPTRYYIGHLAFEGLINYTTYQGNLSDFNPGSVSIQTVEGLQTSKEFFSPRYESKTQQESRIPDRRHLLHWTPEVKMDNHGKSDLSFFSSDVPGTYLVVVQCLSEAGEPGSVTIKFQVKK